MKQEQLMDIFVLAKRIGNLLAEVDDLTGQLVDAVNRQDEVSINLLAAMRAEPIQKLAEADRAMRGGLVALGDGENRIRAILNGNGAVAQGETEQALAAQAAQNIRQHKRLLEKDKAVNQKITRDKSIYQ